MQDDTINTGASSKLSRRTLAAGAAWSVPAIAVASAAPAYANSGAPPTLTLQKACKLPGNSCHLPGLDKGYKFVFKVKNNDNETIYLCNPTFSPTGTQVDPLTYVGAPCIQVAAGDTATIPIFAQGSSSANLTFNTVMTVQWGHTCPCSDDPMHHAALTSTITVTSTAPDCDSCTGTT